MKTTAVILLLILAAAPVLAIAATPPTTPLRANSCIDTTQINEWHIVDARTAIVRTGPKRYRVDLKNDCPQLKHPSGLIFGANESNKSTNRGRICGETGETVRSTNQAPCAIQSVRLIDKAKFDELERQADGNRPGTSAPTP